MYLTRRRFQEYLDSFYFFEPIAGDARPEGWAEEWISYEFGRPISIWGDQWGDASGRVYALPDWVVKIVKKLYDLDTTQPITRAAAERLLTGRSTQYYVDDCFWPELLTRTSERQYITFDDVIATLCDILEAACLSRVGEYTIFPRGKIRIENDDLISHTVTVVWLKDRSSSKLVRLLLDTGGRVERAMIEHLIPPRFRAWY